MLIRIIKVTMWIVFKFTMWIGLPFWKLLYRLMWRGTPQQFVIALTEDPDIVRRATETGMAGILKMYQQKCMAIADAPKSPTQEDRDWAEFIQKHFARNIGPCAPNGWRNAPISFANSKKSRST